MRVYLKRCLQGVLVLGLILTVGVAVVAQAGGSPRLRLAYTSPGGPPADFYVDGNLVFPNVPYRGITDYITLSPGNHTIRGVPAGTSGPVALEPTLPLADGRDYTLLVVGKPDNIQAQQLEDDNNPPPAGKTRVRLIHASPDAPAIDVCLTGQQNCPVTNLTFKGASGYINLNGGTYNLDIRRAGTNEVILNQQDLRLVEGTVYSLLLVGLLQGEPGLQLIIRADAGRPPITPPVTGAFLSPTALMVLTWVMVGLIGGAYVTRRWFIRN
jgi:hypothetical protein